MFSKNIDLAGFLAGSSSLLSSSSDSAALALRCRRDRLDSLTSSWTGFVEERKVQKVQNNIQVSPARQAARRLSEFAAISSDDHLTTVLL